MYPQYFYLVLRLPFVGNTVRHTLAIFIFCCMNVRKFRKIFPLMDGEEFRRSKESMETTGMNAEQESDIVIKGRGTSEPW